MSRRYLRCRMLSRDTETRNDPRHVWVVLLEPTERERPDVQASDPQRFPRGSTPSRRQGKNRDVLTLRFTGDLQAMNAVVLLSLILAFSFVMNASHLTWGLPDLWHPDEVTWRSAQMLLDGTANPKFFKYPTLHLYLVTIFAGLPHFVGARAAGWRSAGELAVAMTPYSRALSAAMGTATVFITYQTAQRLFGRTSGLFAAVILATTAGFIGFSHFATVDLPL